MHAITHSKGVVLGKRYVPLELAYRDVTGTIVNFQITSPMTFSKMRKCFPRCRPDSKVCVDSGIAYSDVLLFLKDRYDFLQQLFPSEPIVFGYKGEYYQPIILRDAGIPNIVNVEKFGMPPLKPVLTSDISCDLHKGNLNKCALVALDQIASYFR